MTIKSLQLPRVKDPDTQKALDRVKESLAVLPSKEILNGVLLKDVTLAEAGTVVSHTLGRVPNGYLVVGHNLVGGHGQDYCGWEDYQNVDVQSFHITKAGFSGSWNAGAYGGNRGLVGDGSLTFQISSPAGRYAKIGFSTSFAGYGTNDIDWAIYVRSNGSLPNITVVEGSTYYGASTPTEAVGVVGEVFRLLRLGTKIYYQRDDNTGVMRTYFTSVEPVVGTIYPQINIHTAPFSVFEAELKDHSPRSLPLVHKTLPHDKNHLYLATTSPITVDLWVF